MNGNEKKRILSGKAALAIAALALGAAATSAQASTLVTNGSFESISNGSGGVGEFDSSTYTTVTGWTSSGYNFIFTPGSADTTGVQGSYGKLELWGPNNGSANGLPATSPDGGNYVAADGAFQIGAIQQTISGLVIGDTYTVGFWWAGAQQSGYDGTNTEQWQVTLGSQTQATAVAPNANHGFTGWMYQTFNYTATGTSEVLSFLAVGTPNGEPPFSLLDGVSVNMYTVPEPGTMSLLFSGLGLVVLGLFRTRKRK